MNSLLSLSRVAIRRSMRLNHLIPACISVRFNHYKTLGLKRNATQMEVDQAFDALAREFTSKVNKSRDESEEFAKIRHAHYVLTDHDSRRDYDRTLGPCSDPDEYPFHNMHPDFKYAHDLRFGRDRFDQEFADQLKREDEAIMEMRQKLVPWLIAGLAVITFLLIRSILKDSHLSKSAEVDRVEYLSKLEKLHKEGTFTTSVDSGQRNNNDLVMGQYIPEWKPK